MRCHLAEGAMQELTTAAYSTLPELENALDWTAL
ncbi:hypothetical protein PF008_g26931 [Phytophthora fragariae]|uniref:Uncharacterized protein n=1 Tax=Phytophthora fragariae TaxID=53985 RepID=A0A6G0QFT8_9STRA|nr:hypothetical protein PF003_g40669 [Phytophthora fragariae]KAE9285370.1 hypothetical protein PF008_g26931 [Phytophthora fragariae]